MKLIKPIAYIHSPYQEKFSVPRQSGLNNVESVIEFDFNDNEQERLRGLENFSHLWVIFEFHLIDEDKVQELVVIRPPRLGGKEKIGMYATRTPHRPNRLGLSLVEIISVNKNKVHIRGGDFVNGTPVFDIKPYLKETEAISNARSGWCEDLPDENKILVSFSAEVLNSSINENELKILAEILSLDPRPSYKKKTKDSSLESFAVHLLSYNVHFKIFDDEKTLIVTKIEILK